MSGHHREVTLSEFREACYRLRAVQGGRGDDDGEFALPPRARCSEPLCERQVAKATLCLVCYQRRYRYLTKADDRCSAAGCVRKVAWGSRCRRCLDERSQNERRVCKRPRLRDKAAKAQHEDGTRAKRLRAR